MNNPRVLIIHHTAVGGTTPQLTGVNRYHRAQGFPISSLKYYVGYHYFIEKDGRVTRTRADSDIGAHTIGWNDKSIGVCLAGDFNYEKPTTVQLSALKKLTKQYPDFLVDLHRNRQANRTCPGTNFRLDLLKEADSVDLEKARMIAYYMRKFPSLKSWLQRFLKIA